MRMRLVLFGRARHSVRAVFSIAIHDSPAFAVATARRARKHSDSVSASSNHFSSALLNHANRSQRAPPQPFGGQAREKFLRA
jgi:hypothetical protein